MDVSVLRDPVFIAKIVDFVVFVIALVFVWNKVIAAQLESQQEKQNKEVEDAQRALVEAKAAIETARVALDRAESDSRRMVEFGAAQADRLVVDSKAEAEEHAARVTTHAERRPASASHRPSPPGPSASSSARRAMSRSSARTPTTAASSGRVGASAPGSGST